MSNCLRALIWALETPFIISWGSISIFPRQKWFLFRWNDHLESNCSTTSGLTKNQSIILKALYKCFPKTDKLGVSNTPPGNLLQFWTISVKNMLPNFKPKLPQAQFEPFQCVLLLDPKGQRSAPPSNTSFPQESEERE